MSLRVPGERRAKASYEIAQKKRKIKAAQNRNKPRSSLSVSERQDVEAYLREMSKGVPIRDMAGKVVGYRGKKHG